MQNLPASSMKNKNKGLFDMNNIDIMKTENNQDQVKELFRESVSVEVYDRWADSFEIEPTPDNQIIITYDGIESFKEFKKECKKVLSFCIY